MNSDLELLKLDLQNITQRLDDVISDISEIEERIKKIDAIIEKHNIEEPQSGKRFIVDERNGIIAVYDRSHREYIKTAGCHPDYDWCVASWLGFVDETTTAWRLHDWQREKANHLAKMLNELHESD